LGQPGRHDLFGQFYPKLAPFIVSTVWKKTVKTCINYNTRTIFSPSMSLYY
jgi:hypothetical protein